ncbi:MAG: hypothetical protein HQ488_00645 [Parcubacteria group bacterium]|nr:hypothetical protein [Parcubacteria group bacterium]
MAYFPRNGEKMKPNPRDRAFLMALDSMNDPHLPWGLRFSILQDDIPEGYFVRNGHSEFMRHFWATLSLALPGSALEMRLFEKLSLPNMGAVPTWISVCGPTSWPVFWVHVILRSDARGGIHTLAVQRLRTVTGGTAELCTAATELARQDGNEQLVARLRTEAIEVATDWWEWKLIIGMETDVSADARVKALQQLRELPVERDGLEPSLSTADPEVRLIVIDRLLETFPERPDLWRRRFLTVSPPDERYQCWIKFLSVTPPAHELTTVLFHVWNNKPERARCLEAIEHLDAQCPAWIYAHSASYGAPHDDPKLHSIREVIWQRIFATAQSCHDWCQLTRFMRRRHEQGHPLVNEAFEKALDLAENFEELSDVYSLCLHEVADGHHRRTEHDPARAQVIQGLLVRMEEIGAFWDYWNGHHLLMSDRLSRIVCLASTPSQMGLVYNRHFQLPYQRDDNRELYDELLRRMHAAGPSLVTSFLPKPATEAQPRT